MGGVLMSGAKEMKPGADHEIIECSRSLLQ